MTAERVNGFDRLAPMYDRLARAVFGSRMFNAQTHFLSMIPPSSRVLILGGGTGWLLCELLRQRPECEVWYLESSSGMIAEAKKRNPGHPNVHYVLGTETAIPGTGFDVVIAHFFFDLFSAYTLPGVVSRIGAAMRPGAFWLVADFVHDGKWWQSAMLKIMYAFFRVTCGIEASDLPAWQEVLGKSGLRIKAREAFYGGFIESSVYIGSAY